MELYLFCGIMQYPFTLAVALGKRGALSKGYEADPRDL
jgi:hypothetical protein